MTTSAKATLGIVKRTVRKGYYNDPELLRLVEKRKELRRLEYSDNRPVSHSELCTQINKAKRDIQRRLTEIETAKACALCTCIMSTDSMRQMYQAVRELTISRRGNDIVHVHDDDGNPLCSDEANSKAEKIAEYFKKQFTDPVNPPLEPFQGDPRDLDVPITSDEVKKAVGKLKNGKSNGPDNIPNELIKA